MISLEEYMISKRNNSLKNLLLIFGIIIFLGYFVNADVFIFITAENIAPSKIIASIFNIFFQL